MRRIGMLFQEPEMIQHRMVVGKVELADDTDGVMPGLHAGKLDALIGVVQFATREMAEEVEMPPGTAEFAVGRELQAGRGLPMHDLFDLHILGLAQIISRDLALLESGTRFLDARRPQQATDLVGAEGGFGSLHGRLLKNPNAPNLNASSRRRRRDSVRAPRDRPSMRYWLHHERSRRVPISQHD